MASSIRSAGKLYIRDLVDQVPTPASAGHYAAIVAKAALRRRLIGAAADIMEMAYASVDDAETVADDAEQRIYDVARREDRDEMAILRDLVDQAMFDLESIQNRESAFTGLPDRVPRSRRAHVGAAGRQPGRHRGAARCGQVLVRDEPGAQRGRRRASPRRSSPSRCRAGRSGCGCCAPRRGSPGIGSATSASVRTTGPASCRRPRCCMTPRCPSSTRATSTSSTSGPRPVA